MTRTEALNELICYAVCRSDLLCRNCNFYNAELEEAEQQKICDNRTETKIIRAIKIMQYYQEKEKSAA